MPVKEAIRRVMFIGSSGPLEVRADTKSISKKEGCGVEELYVQRPCSRYVSIAFEEKHHV